MYRDCNEKHQPPIAKWYPKGKMGIGYDAKLPPAQGVAPALLDAQKPDLQSVFNGDFEYMNYGWERTNVSASQKNVHLKPNAILKHHIMVFPNRYHNLQWHVKATAPLLQVSFFDAKGNLLLTVKPTTMLTKEMISRMSVQLPKNLIGNVGSFSIQNFEKHEIITDNFVLTP
jgi:hypothetical protein